MTQRTTTPIDVSGCRGRAGIWSGQQGSLFSGNNGDDFPGIGDRGPLRWLQML